MDNKELKKYIQMKKRNQLFVSWDYYLPNLVLKQEEKVILINMVD